MIPVTLSAYKAIVYTCVRWSKCEKTIMARMTLKMEAKGSGQMKDLENAEQTTQLTLTDVHAPSLWYHRMQTQAESLYEFRSQYQKS